MGETEHPSVLSGGRFSAGQIRQIPVDSQGLVRLEALESPLAEAAAKGQHALVSSMLANNETGAIQPVADVARIGHSAGAIVHTDAVQAAGRIPGQSAAARLDVLT